MAGRGRLGVASACPSFAGRHTRTIAHLSDRKPAPHVRNGMVRASFAHDACLTRARCLGWRPCAAISRSCSPPACSLPPSPRPSPCLRSRRWAARVSTRRGRAPERREPCRWPPTASTPPRRPGRQTERRWRFPPVHPRGWARPRRSAHTSVPRRASPTSTSAREARPPSSRPTRLPRRLRWARGDSRSVTSMPTGCASVRPMPAATPWPSRVGTRVSSTTALCHRSRVAAPRERTRMCRSGTASTR